MGNLKPFLNAATCCQIKHFGSYLNFGTAQIPKRKKENIQNGKPFMKMWFINITEFNTKTIQAFKTQGIEI